MTNAYNISKLNISMKIKLKKNQNIKSRKGMSIKMLLTARCDLYYIFTVIDSYRQKKQKNNNTGMGVILLGVGRDFPPVFSWDWDGKRLKFVMHFGNRR